MVGPRLCELAPVARDGQEAVSLFAHICSGNSYMVNYQ